ncbi:MAG: hypothetical protein ACQEQV_04720 [Fibrobacterota bacterium]
MVFRHFSNCLYPAAVLAGLLWACSPSAVVTEQGGSRVELSRIAVEKQCVPLKLFTGSLAFRTDRGSMQLNLNDLASLTFEDAVVQRGGHAWIQCTAVLADTENPQTLEGYLRITDTLWGKSDFGPYSIDMGAVEGVEFNPQDEE